LAVDDAGLALGPAIIGCYQGIEGLLRGAAGAEKREAVGEVAKVGEGLRGDGAERGTYAGHDRASGEELACDGDPPSLAVGAARHEGKGHDAE